MYYEMIGFVQEHHAERPCEEELPEVDLSKAALFLDFDGTLVDLAPRPDAIEVPQDLLGLLGRLSARTGGRLVIVTGRAIADVSSHLGDYDGPVIGSHGAEHRFDKAVEPHPLANSDIVQRFGDMTDAFATLHPGLIAERKPTGVVLHFRQAPSQEANAYTFLHALEASHEGFDLHHSKMAYELRPRDISKDASIRRVMERPDFRGRRPIFFGDDVTDEPALHWVAEQEGGIAVKVGTGDTSAGYRLPSPEAARAALATWAEA